LKTIRYIAYFLKLKDLDRAREVAENALERICFQHEAERFNIWVAYLNLEASFGTPETLNDTFRKAIQYNNPKQIYLQMTHIYQQRNNVDKCLEFCKKCVDKYPNSKKVMYLIFSYYDNLNPQTWMRYIMCLLELAVENKMDTETNVRGVLLRALNRLPKKKQVDVLCATARAEMKIGSIER
jgi:rRNA biogenesis protein RRP5